MIEEWRPINRTYGNYAVSNMGRVMNVDRDKVLKTKDKGKTVSLMYENGKNRSYSITRLMYSAFVGEIPEGYYVVCDGAVTVDNLRLEHQNERKRLAGMASARQRRGNFIPGESPNEMIASWLRITWRLTNENT